MARRSSSAERPRKFPAVIWCPVRCCRQRRRGPGVLRATDAERLR